MNVLSLIYLEKLHTNVTNKIICRNNYNIVFVDYFAFQFLNEHLMNVLSLIYAKIVIYNTVISFQFS